MRNNISSTSHHNLTFLFKSKFCKKYFHKQFLNRAVHNTADTEIHFQVNFEKIKGSRIYIEMRTEILLWITLFTFLIAIRTFYYFNDTRKAVNNIQLHACLMSCASSLHLLLICYHNPVTKVY